MWEICYFFSVSWQLFIHPTSCFCTIYFFGEEFSVWKPQPEWIIRPINNHCFSHVPPNLSTCIHPDQQNEQVPQLFYIFKHCPCSIWTKDLANEMDNKLNDNNDNPANELFLTTMPVLQQSGNLQAYHNLKFFAKFKRQLPQWCVKCQALYRILKEDIKKSKNLTW